MTGLGGGGLKPLPGVTPTQSATASPAVSRPSSSRTSPALSALKPLNAPPMVDVTLSGPRAENADAEEKVEPLANVRLLHTSALAGYLFSK